MAASGGYWKSGSFFSKTDVLMNPNLSPEKRAKLQGFRDETLARQRNEGSSADRSLLADQRLIYDYGARRARELGVSTTRLKQ